MYPHLFSEIERILVDTATMRRYCTYMNKTTYDNIEGRQDALCKVGDGLEEIALVIDYYAEPVDPSDFDEMMVNLIGNLEKLLAAAKAVRDA